MPVLPERADGGRPAPPRWSVRGRAGYVTLVLALNGALAVAALFIHYGWQFPPCGFKQMAGFGCPGCGLTRSVIALVHGNLSLSLHYHLFGPLVVFWVAAGWIYGLVGLTRTPPPASIWESRWTLLVIVAHLVLYLGYWAIRVGTGTTV